MCVCVRVGGRTGRIFKSNTKVVADAEHFRRSKSQLDNFHGKRQPSWQQQVAVAVAVAAAGVAGVAATAANCFHININSRP